MVYDYLFGPLLAIVAVTVLIAVSRWAFGTRKGSPRPPSHVPDHGLLTPVTTVRPRAEAEQLAASLRAHGIRATTAHAGEGVDARGMPWPADATHVLVFPADLARARAAAGLAPR